MAHSRFSPSATEREFTCPGSFLLNEMEADRQSPDAAHGTAAHHIGELCLRLDHDVETYAGCLIAVDKLTGEKVEGPKVTVQMAKDAGWWNKNGSYWPKMTEMMLKYRAAAYFARAECPEVLMGANIDYEAGDGDSAEEEPNHA